MKEKIVLQAIRRVLSIFDLDLKSLLSSKAIIILNINIHHQNIKEELALQAVWQILVYLALTFDSKVVSVIWNFCCHLQTKGNHYVKYEHPPSKMKEELALQAVWQILSIFDLDLLFQGHISYLKSAFSSSNHRQSLCQIGTPTE